MQEKSVDFKKYLIYYNSTLAPSRPFDTPAIKLPAPTINQGAKNIRNDNSGWRQRFKKICSNGSKNFLNKTL